MKRSSKLDKSEEVSILPMQVQEGHKFEPQKSLSNVNILGANINPTKSNQTIFAGGEAILPQATVATIDADATNKALITKEWYNSKTSTSLSNYYTKSEAVNMFVGLNSVQTIGGTKTFNASPIVPTPTLSTHAVNKGYVDGLTHPTYKNTTIQGRAIGDYQFHVIPLCELTNDVIGADRFSDVKMLFKRSNTIQGLITELKITVAKIYNTDTPFVSFNHDGTNVSNLKFRIVTFTYNSKKYIGVDIRVIADYSNNWIIEGYSNQWSIISAINYYTQNTNTVVNAEIKDSIVEYVPDANINYNPYRKFSSGIESYGFKKVGSSDGHMLLGNGGHRQLTDFMLSTHPANDITTTNINNWNTAYGWGNHASVGYAMANHTHNWNDIENKPLTFVPTSHTHAISEVTGLSTELNKKSEKNTDEEWNSKKYLSNPFPLIFNDPTENTRRFCFYKPNNISSVILVPSTEPDSDNWNWANQIEFKENGKIKNKGYEIAGYDNNSVLTAGGSSAHKKELLWSRKLTIQPSSTNAYYPEPQGQVTNIDITGHGSTDATVYLPQEAYNGQIINIVNYSAENIKISGIDAGEFGIGQDTMVTMTFVFNTNNIDGVTYGTGRWVGMYMNQFNKLE
ncbi:MAG: hypothetical protein E6R13_05130 [Spirochaetes bacterium]|nr:MAG: hypothetical protein E6R13_05130 [Spirochaetota bacterium]